MLSRRTMCCVLPLAVAATWPRRVLADDCKPFTREMQTTTSPQQALERLRRGNARFVAGKSLHCDLPAQVGATAGGQAPFAAVVGCIDSRVPPEIVFDQGIGDLFCARIAGNFVDTEIIGSMEFATAVSGAKAIVVLGHSRCGAIRGAIDGVQLGNLTATLEHLMPAVVAVVPDPDDRDSSDPGQVQRVAEANVRINVDELTRRSDLLAGLVSTGALAIVGAMHDVTTGEVTFL